MKTYKPFDYSTQHMDPELKKDWIDFMKANPQLYEHGTFHNRYTGCLCALGALIKVLGGNPATIRQSFPGVEGPVGRYDVSFHFLGPKYESVYGQNDQCGAYPIAYIEANL